MSYNEGEIHKNRPYDIGWRWCKDELPPIFSHASFLSINVVCDVDGDLIIGYYHYQTEVWLNDATVEEIYPEQWFKIPPPLHFKPVKQEVTLEGLAERIKTLEDKL